MTRSCPNGTLLTRTGTGIDQHVYSDSDPEHVKYAKELGIPPAYPKVDICNKGGRVVYVAKDKEGRTQTRYSKGHDANREEVAKPGHFRKLTPDVWAGLERAVLAATKPEQWSVKKLAATAVLLIQACFFRPGTKAAKGDNAHYGVVTLLVKHVTRLTNKACEFEFVGKAGKVNTCTVAGGGPLHTLLMQLTQGKQPTDRLFRHGNRSLQAGDVRKFLNHATNKLVRAKDIRTYEANLTFISALRGIPVGETKAAATKRILEAVDRTAARLNNTRAIARKSYILVPVMAAAEAGLLDKVPPGEKPAMTLANILKNSKN